MSLIVVFASLALVQYRYSVIRAREAVLKEDLFRLRDAIDQYHADRNHYPPRLDDLVTDGYLRQIPVDPMTDSTATWQGVPAEPQPGDEFDPGIYDVKSGSEGIAMDGTRYTDW
jgi:general secretion pathway protein G